LSRLLAENRRGTHSYPFRHIRGYWSPEVTGSGPVGDDARKAIEAETINAPSGAAAAADEFGPTEEGTFGAAQATLQTRISVCLRITLSSPFDTSDDPRHCMQLLWIRLSS
jgi:hypothetical protein